MRNLIRFLKLNVQLDSSARTPLTTHLPRGVLLGCIILQSVHTHTWWYSRWWLLLKYSIHSWASRRQRDITVRPHEGHFNNWAWEEATAPSDDSTRSVSSYFEPYSGFGKEREVGIQSGLGDLIIWHELLISGAFLIIGRNQPLGPFRVILHSTNPRTPPPLLSSLSPSQPPLRLPLHPLLPPRAAWLLLTRSPSGRMGPVASDPRTPDR